MDLPYPQLTRQNDSLHSSQEALLSENEFLFLKKELPVNLLDDMGLLVEDSSSLMLKQDPSILDPYAGTIPSKSATCTLPCTEDWPGPYNFEVLVNSMSSSKKTWLFSYPLNKVFIDVFKSIPLQFKIDFPNEEDALYVRALPVYTVAQYMSYPVNRCPLHLREDENKGLNNIEHVIRCEDQCANYEFDEDSRRYSVVVPLGHPQAGSDVVTLMYSLVCKSSCCGGMNRRPIMIIFTLENHSQRVVGRKTLNIRVCSCPKRDKEKEEKSAIDEKTGEVVAGALNSGKRLIEPKDPELPTSIQPLKKQKSLFSPPHGKCDKKVYNVKLYGTAHCKEVLRHSIMLKICEHNETGSQEALHAREEYQNTLKQIENEPH